jgi:ADP-heptose:LPS heptosyltransferase
MKILVLSLLRIGDIVLSAPVLRALREQNPKAEIHLMLNSQFKQIAALLPYIDRIVPFERDRLQKGLGEGAVPVFDSYERLSEQLDELNATNYDWVINLTQNRLSGWLTSMITAKTRTGLCFDAQGRASFGSNWFKYLNSQVDSEGSEVFHFADVFRNGLSLGEDIMQRSALVETVAGRKEADAFVAEVGAKEVVCVQALTSDVKKDWGFERFAAALEQFRRSNTGSPVTFAILGAPFERDRLQPLMSLLKDRGVRAELAILTFEGAFSLLRKAKLLLTGDTSVKHLACAARTPVVEISLGSSDVYRTGAYQHGSVIIQSREACAPCPHSKACHRESHACASKISPEVVAMVASEVYGARTFQLKAIAEEFENEIEILRVDTRSTGTWSAYSVVEAFSEKTIGRWLDLACRRLWLENPTGEASDNMGTETLRLTRLMRAIHPEVSEIEWRHLFADFERQALGVDGRVNGFKVGLSYLRGCYEDPKKMTEYVRGLISFRERIRHSPLLRSFKSALDQVIEDDISPAFTRFRRISDLVTEIERRTDIHLRLIRGLAQSSEAEQGIERT